MASIALRVGKSGSKEMKRTPWRSFEPHRDSVPERMAGRKNQDQFILPKGIANQSGVTVTIGEGDEP